MRLPFPKSKYLPVKMRKLPQTHKEAHVFWAERLESVCLNCVKDGCSGAWKDCIYVEAENSREVRAVCPECESAVPDNPPTLQGLKGTLPELTCAAVMVVNQQKRELILEECDITPRTLSSLSRKIGALYCVACDEVINPIKRNIFDVSIQS